MSFVSNWVWESALVFEERLRPDEFGRETRRQADKRKIEYSMQIEATQIEINHFNSERSSV